MELFVQNLSQLTIYHVLYIPASVVTVMLWAGNVVLTVSLLDRVDSCMVPECTWYSINTKIHKYTRLNQRYIKTKKERK